MNIYEATKEAARVGGYIARPFGVGRKMVIKPTNGGMCCLLWPLRGERNWIPRWQPKAKDLMAEDWEVIRK